MITPLLSYIILMNYFNISAAICAMWPFLENPA